jgi:sulfur relay (sulfurtransferase) DsrC/TusE family protein
MKNKQLKIGVKVESEHAKTYRLINTYWKSHHKMPPKKVVFASIAKDHLKENKRYYTKLAKAKL